MKKEKNNKNYIDGSLTGLAPKQSLILFSKKFAIISSIVLILSILTCVILCIISFIIKSYICGVSFFINIVSFSILLHIILKFSPPKSIKKRNTR